MNQPKSEFEFDQLPGEPISAAPAPIPPVAAEAPARKRRGPKPGAKRGPRRTLPVVPAEVVEDSVRQTFSSRAHMVQAAIDILSKLEDVDRKYIMGLFA